VPIDSYSAENNFQNDARRSIIVKARKADEVKVTLDMFELQTQLGRGTFGKVFLAKLVTTGEEYAIKVIRKDMLLEYDQIESTLLEKKIFVLG